MPDILSQGRGRELGPWPRRGLAAVAIVLAVLAIVYYLPRSKPAHPAATASASPTPSSAPVAVPGAVAGAVSGDGAVASEPDGITGRVLSWPSGLRLLAAGQQPAWFWPATGRKLVIGALPAQQSGYQFTRVAGGWAVQAAAVSSPACADCAGPRRPVFFLADTGLSATPVGLADAVAGGTAGTLWLSSYQSGADTSQAAATAQQVSVAGAPIGAALTLPAGYLIVAGTSRGLLLEPVAPQPGKMADKLWDPAAPRATLGLADVIAVSPTLLASAPPCAVRCRVQLLNLATGRQRSVELPASSSVANAAFSPDGKYLALQVSFGDNDDDGQLAVQLESVSTASGHLTVVPQSFASSDALVGFGWPASGDSLVAQLSFTSKEQLASWQPGAARLAIVTLTPAHTPAALVIGQYLPTP